MAESTWRLIPVRHSTHYEILAAQFRAGLMALGPPIDITISPYGDGCRPKPAQTSRSGRQTQAHTLPKTRLSPVRVRKGRKGSKGKKPWVSFPWCSVVNRPGAKATSNAAARGAAIIAEQ